MPALKVMEIKQLRPQMERAWNIVKEQVEANQKIVIEIKKWSRTMEQNRKFHVMIRDIHQQKFRGNRFGAVKALCVREFEVEYEASSNTKLRYPSDVIWSRKLQEWVTNRPSTRDFSIEEGGQFIEYLYMFGTEEGVNWSEKAAEIYQSYKEAA